jgi:intracellular sulfur oxidation DsrE/DsrF family protein
MKKILLLSILIMHFIGAFAQADSHKPDSAYNALVKQRDSTLKASIHADSVKIQKEYADKLKIATVKSIATRPQLNGGDFSGVIPVKDVTEVPDPSLDYKLLFELVSNNPDSLSKQINTGLTEVARVINLHVASGIPVKKIFPVIVVHGPGLNAFTKNEYYKEHFNTDNPNIKLINDMAALGAKFIACGQAMYFFDVKSDALLPLVKVSLTAQTVISSYTLKGYVKYRLD